MSLKLINPSLGLEKEYSSFVKNYILDKQEYYTVLRDLYNDNKKDIKNIITNQISWNNNKNLPEGWFPVSIFWFKKDNEIIGEAIIRHELNAMLENFAGHITYYIAPAYRGGGYGKKILQFIISKAHKIGIDNILLCCDKKNVVSKKIIEASGAKYIDSIDNLQKWGEITLRYTLKTGNSLLSRPL